MQISNDDINLFGFKIPWLSEKKKLIINNNDYINSKTFGRRSPKFSSFEKFVQWFMYDVPVIKPNDNGYYDKDELVFLEKVLEGNNWAVNIFNLFIKPILEINNLETNPQVIYDTWEDYPSNPNILLKKNQLQLPTDKKWKEDAELLANYMYDGGVAKQPGDTTFDPQVLVSYILNNPRDEWEKQLKDLLEKKYNITEEEWLKLRKTILEIISNSSTFKNLDGSVEGSHWALPFTLKFSNLIDDDIIGEKDIYHSTVFNMTSGDVKKYFDTEKIEKDGETFVKMSTDLDNADDLINDLKNDYTRLYYTSKLSQKEESTIDSLFDLYEKKPDSKIEFFSPDNDSLEWGNNTSFRDSLKTYKESSMTAEEALPLFLRTLPVANSGNKNMPTLEWFLEKYEPEIRDFSDGDVNQVIKRLGRVGKKAVDRDSSKLPFVLKRDHFPEVSKDTEDFKTYWDDFKVSDVSDKYLDPESARSYVEKNMKGPVSYKNRYIGTDLADSYYIWK